MEEGPEEAPAELITGKPAQSLAARDKEVRLALNTLKGHGSLIQARAAPLTVRALVP